MSFRFEVDYSFSKDLLLTAPEIVAGARFLEDHNPIHTDPVVASESRFGSLIACGPHVSGLHACMLPTHATSLGLSVLGTVFTVKYRAPVFAGAMHVMSWQVVSVADHRSGGQLVDWIGTVSRVATVCIEATGQILVNPNS